MKKIVITGATGMIGLALINTALETGMEVLAIVRPNSGRRVNCPQNESLKIIECSLEDLHNLQIEEEYDAFYHLAWDKTFGDGRDNTYKQTDNIKYTLDAVNLAKRLKCKSFIGAGSQAEYGNVTDKISGSTAVNPQSGYGIAKYAAGKLSRILCSQLEMRYNWARILSVYGEHDAPHTLIMYCISTLLKNEKPVLTKCDQIWDYLYCKDAAAALISIGMQGVDGKAYCLGSGIAQPLRRYIEEIRDIINPSLELGFGEKPYYANQAMYLYADIAELTADTGFSPHTSFKDGIQKTIEWCKKNEKN